MKLQISSCSLATPERLESPLIFEAVAERRVALSAAVKPLLRSVGTASVVCQHEARPARDCMRCAHFLNAFPSPDLTELTVRCLFLESDLVDVLMTPVTRLLSVDASASLEIARELLRHAGVRQLVVTSLGVAVGLVTAEDMGAGDGEVGACLTVPIPVVPRTATLGRMERIMRELPCVLVVDGDDVVGLITRGDLRRAGVPDGDR